MALAPSLESRLSLPLIAAPMFTVSGPELVAACCVNGVIGAFPTANARSDQQLDEWLDQLDGELRAHQGPTVAPVCANLIVSPKMNPRLAQHTEIVQRHQVEIIITSVGSPAEVVGAIHEYGGIVLADVSTMHHAERAVAAGVDGLVLLTAGAGGQTGWANPFAFVRQVRAFYDGIVVLAGGITDAAGIKAAEMLGCDLAYMGTRFIATDESRAAPEYKQMIVDSRIDDVVLSTAFGLGLETNMLRESIETAGLDPAVIKRATEPVDAKQYSRIWSAGHSAGGVEEVLPAGVLIQSLMEAYESL
jgi:nitronate monooxygenase